MSLEFFGQNRYEASGKVLSTMRNIIHALFSHNIYSWQCDSYFRPNNIAWNAKKWHRNNNKKWQPQRHRQQQSKCECLATTNEWVSGLPHPLSLALSLSLCMCICNTWYEHFSSEYIQLLLKTTRTLNWNEWAKCLGKNTHKAQKLLPYIQWKHFGKQFGWLRLCLGCWFELTFTFHHWMQNTVYKVIKHKSMYQTSFENTHTGIHVVYVICKV